MADINGTSGNDTINGTPEDDTINAGDGHDTVNALGGNDTVNGGHGGDTLTGGEGNDRLFGGTSQDFLYGGVGNDYLDGGSGGADWTFGNRLYGGEGDDTLISSGSEIFGGSDMYGGPGNDTYYVTTAGYFGGPFSPSNPPDRVFEVAGEGYDTVYLVTSQQWTFGPDQDIEAIIVQFTDRSANIFGTDIDNVLVGGPQADHIGGLGGDDVIVGGLGADLMEGGAGSDTYYVDNAGDEIIEPVAAGIDRVAASVSYVLDRDADIEILEAVNLSATTALTFVGNQFGQTLIGNAGSNVLHGEGGADTLLGLAGDDFLVGGSGNDTMDGGSGNDTFYVDAAEDVVIEAVGGGTDRVASTVSYTLSAGAAIEQLEAGTLSSTTAMNLFGNEFANVITGNNGVNVLNGGAGNDVLNGLGGDDFLIGGSGADSMAGGAGNDVYYVDNSSDQVLEWGGEGSDRIATSVSLELSGVSEVERLDAVNTAGTEALVLTGSDYANTIIGNAGVNTLNGRGGSDVLVGLGGADTFQFTTALGSGNIDKIEDFEAGIDEIALDDAVFTFANSGSLDPASFRIGSAAVDADDRIVYDSATGALYYDADGNGGGAAVQFATLQTGLGLTAGDFVVI